MSPKTFDIVYPIVIGVLALLSIMISWRVFNMFGMGVLASIIVVVFGYLDFAKSRPREN